jgi:phosphate starvation-inducible PhoH-like protein
VETIKLKPKSKNQADYIRTIVENQITVCIGPAGSGKTLVPCALASKALLEQRIEKIILTRPIVEAGRGLGFLPGDMLAKVNHYMIPCMEELGKFLDVGECIKNGLIEIVPPELMRGRNFHNCFIIADESQNLDYGQLVLLLSRFGRNSKMVINGDPDQCDIGEPFLQETFKALENVEGVGLIKLHQVDIVRNKIIGNILKRMNNAHLRNTGHERENSETTRNERSFLDFQFSEAGDETPNPYLKSTY